MLLYEEWLSTASEKELFVFIESTIVVYLEEEGRLSAQDESDMQTNVDCANENLSSRFGVTDRNEWYRENLTGWHRGLTREEWLEWLRKMPWNLTEKG